MPGEKTTDEEILSQITANTGDDLGDGAEEQEDDAPAEGEAGEADEADGSAGEDDGADEQDGGEGADDEQDDQQDGEVRQSDARQDDAERQRTVKYDAKGNIVDAKGNIIARNGAERRVFEQNTRLKQRVSDQDRIIAAARKHIADTQFLNGVPAKYGLNNDEVAQGLQLLATFKVNPTEAARIVLAEVMKTGVSLKDIVGGADDGTGANSLDMRAIKALIDERTAPLAKKEAEDRQLAESKRAVDEAFNAFTSDYPDALVNEDALIRVMQQTERPGDTMYQRAERAWLHLSSWCDKQGFDPTKPLAPQIEAARASQRGGDKQQQQRGPRRPLPNGRGSREVDASAQPQMAAATDDWNTIIKRAMAD